MEWFHDRQHDVLIYPARYTPNPTYLPEARPINGSWFGVKRTLRNCQILRYLNFPVPFIIDDSNYDFPIAPGRKPLDTQRQMANFSVLHPRMFNLSDPGCVAGDTLLETDSGPQRIDHLEQQQRPVKIKALVAGAVKLVSADCPFIKGRAALYRVTFQSGRTITVTGKHFFFTCRGWVSCADLVVGERLPKFDGDPPVSTSEFYLSKLLQDAQHSFRKVRGSPDYFDTPVYGGPLHPAEDSAQFLTPSLGDARKRNHVASRADALGTIYKRKGLACVGPLSTQDWRPHAAQYHREFSACESTTRLACSPRCTCGRCLPSSNLAQPILEDRASPADFDRYPAGMEFLLPECGDESLGTSPPIDAQFQELPTLVQEACTHRWSQIDAAPCQQFPVDVVVNIAYVKTDVYYDLHVPKHENYIAHGLCHHNTMKTLSSLWAADWLMKQHPPGTMRCLIVGTLSTLETTWAKEIFVNFMGRRTCEILHGTEPKRIAALAKKADFSIINHDGVGVGAHTRKKFELDGFSKALAEDEGIKIVIADEASAYKDAQTKRHRIARLVIAKRPYLWPLTGSPTPTAPTDAYGLAKLVNNAFGKSFGTFQAETMLKVSQFRWIPQRDGYDKAAKLLSPAIRIPIDAVWDGPKLTTEQREVQLTPQQIKLMKDLKNDLQVTLKQGQPISAVNEASARQKFLQISLGAVYDSDHKVHLVDAGPRYAEVEQVISETTRKIVIFAGLTSVVDLLYKRLHKQFEAEIINGNVPQKARANIIRSFAEPGGLRIVICDPQATAHGINEFVAADTAVWFGTTEKAELYDQGNKRIRRPGQKYPTRAVQLVSNNLEKEIFRRLENNLGLQGSLLSLIQSGQI